MTLDVFISFLFIVRFLTNALCISKSLNLWPISFFVLLVLEGDIHCGGCGGGRDWEATFAAQRNALEVWKVMLKAE